MNIFSQIISVYFGIYFLLFNNEYTEPPIEERTQLQETFAKDPTEICIETLTPLWEEYHSPIDIEKFCNYCIETGADYKFIASIGVVESELCSNVKFPNNCWSLDVYNRKYNNYYDNILDAIELMEYYKRKGWGGTFEMIEETSKHYCPPTHEEWTEKVTNLYLSLE